MLFGFVLLFAYVLLVWLVFFKFKWMTFNIPWAIVSVAVGLHILIIFMIGLRFVTPLATEARMVQHTIQLIPRLSEPTLVTAVLVEPNAHVKKGQPLFQFDQRPYEANVRKLEAELAKAMQHVPVLKSHSDAVSQKVAKLKSELEFAKYQQKATADLAGIGAGPAEDAHKWAAQVAMTEAAIREAKADAESAQLTAMSEIGGVNTTVAAVRADLDLARYYLNNTLMLAPEDGQIINLQVRPGMVAGEVRFGAIASFVADEGRYLLANYFQENLKYVKPGQPVEVAIDLYPGQIFSGRVQSIWQGSGSGQLLPSGVLPSFNYVPTEIPQGQFAVAIQMDGDQSLFPIGAQARAAIYTNPSSPFVWMRRIGIRTYSWLNWLYPFSG